jgi:hypothetical protein
VTPALKARIANAAGSQGKSLTTFLLEAAERAAAKVESRPTAPKKPGGRGACPTWFVARCWEAAQGGTGGYAAAGHALAAALPAEHPWELSDEQWAAALDSLGELIGIGRRRLVRLERDDAAVWAWLEEYVPRCAALIPRRRRQAFLAGLYRAAEDETIALTL